MFTPGLAATTSGVGWLMLASRCRCRPRRATYATLSTELPGSCRSPVIFHAQASGFLKALLCVVTVRGSELAEVPPGLSALPKETLAVGWNGGLPPRNTESLTPRRVK